MAKKTKLKETPALRRRATASIEIAQKLLEIVYQGRRKPRDYAKRVEDIAVQVMHGRVKDVKALKEALAPFGSGLEFLECS